jgi:Fe-Mn family superoxide dismutase
MDAKKSYTLPELEYGYNALAPHMSEEQLKLHHQKHHQAYVTGANALFDRLEKARSENTDVDMKATLKELSFHIGGQRLHSLFWKNLAPAGKGGGGLPSGEIAAMIDAHYGSFARFKKEFTQAASSVEGSGWAVLAYCLEKKWPVIMQVEKHNVNVFPGYALLLVIDVWEHAYYVDYRNDRAKYIDVFWSIVNWGAVNRRLSMLDKAADDIAQMISNVKSGQKNR